MVWVVLSASLALWMYCSWSANQMGAKRNSSLTTFTPLSDEELPQPLKNSLEQRDAEYSTAGFQFTNNLQTSRRGTICISRNYIHRDGLTIACDCVYQRSLGFWATKLTTGIKSVMADGTVVEISSHKSMPDFLTNLKSETKLRLSTGGTHRVNELYSQHLEDVRNAGAQLHSQPLEITEETLNNITEYTLQLCDWQMYRVGILQSPPAPVRLMKAQVNLSMAMMDRHENQS